MTRSRSMTFLAGAAVPVTALAIAGLGTAGSGASALAAPLKAASGRPAAAAAAKPTLGVRTTRLGKVLVDSRGRTLYLFKKDVGTKSACFGACATAWPPLRASGKPKVGAGAHASMVATTKRSDGSPQVTYNRHPLYRFQGDKKAGDTNGEGLNAFGGRWYAVSAAGKQVSKAASSSGGGSGY
jgi:predicted lipoprotein with Yx(FWY)xxD motif